MTSYYVLPQMPDLPATFESLNDDTLTTVLEFVGGKSYKSFGGINKRCRKVYLSTEGMTKETFLYGYGPLAVIQNSIESNGVYRSAREALGKGVLFYNRSDVIDWAVQEQKIYLLKAICDLAVEEERFDLLEEVWNNIGDEDDVFGCVDEYAAKYGKLNVLKWVETKELLCIRKERCAERAAEYGQPHILEWLKKEQDLELTEELYENAICGDFTAGGGHLNVLRWLREQEADWSEWNFTFAAEEGNLEVLQWLRDEGCPWPEDDDYRVRDDILKPEVEDWLYSNGYADRLVDYFYPY